MLLGEVAPFPLHPARMSRHQLDSADDLFEEAVRLVGLAALLEQHRIAALRLLAGIVAGEGLIFVKRGLGLALLLEAADVEKMALDGAVIRVRFAQILQHGLCLGVVAEPEFGPGEAKEKAWIGGVK